MEAPEISVVIPCYNGEATLERQLRALASQRTLRTFEVCIADNRSTDRSAAVIRQFESMDARFRYVRAFENQGINHARNQGVVAARSSVIVLCDADDVVHADWLDAYGRAFDDGAELVGGPLQHVIDGVHGEEQVGFVPSPWIYSWPYGANCGFTRAAFDAVDGFDEEYRGGGDETDFFWRAQIAGFELVYVSDARIDYFSRSSLRGILRQKYFYGKSEVKLYKKFRTLGMRRRPGARALAAVISAPVGFAVGGASNRRRYAGRLGRNLGRIMGSIQEHIWYL